MINKNNNKSKQYDNPASLAREMENMCKSLREHHYEMAADFGFSEESYKNIADTLSNINYSKDDPLISGLSKTLKIRKETLQSYTNKLPTIDVCSSAATSSTATGSVAAIINPSFVNQYIDISLPPHKQSEHNSILIETFNELDPSGSLLNTYKSVWAEFYGNIYDGERAALFSMRQTFDHFFEILAPDEDVRKSHFFKLKDDDRNKESVHRNERLEYAAHKYVNDEYTKNSLLADVSQTIAIYQKLNQLHKRGELNRKACESSIRNMEDVLVEWCQSINHDI